MFLLCAMRRRIYLLLIYIDINIITKFFHILTKNVCTYKYIKYTYYRKIDIIFKNVMVCQF